MPGKITEFVIKLRILNMEAFRHSYNYYLQLTPNLPIIFIPKL